MKHCSGCGQDKPREAFTRLKRRSGNEYASKCKDCDRERVRLMRWNLRLELFCHYSDGEPRCAHCPERRPVVLEIDHIHGGGRAERRSFNTTHAYYLSIKRRGFPEGYRVLCKNCNWIAYIETLEGKRHEQG